MSTGAPPPDPAAIVGYFARLVADEVVARLGATQSVAGAAGVAGDRIVKAKDRPCGLKPPSFKEAARRGKFRTFRVGREVAAMLSDVEAYVRSCAPRRGKKASPPSPANDVGGSVDVAGERMRAALQRRRTG